MPDRDQPDRFVRELSRFGDAAVPAAEFYYAAEDQLAAAGSLTLVSREILTMISRNEKILRSTPAITAFKFGYAAGLAAEAAGTAPEVSRDGLPALEFGIAGPKPSSVRDQLAGIRNYTVGLAGRVVELIPVPEPVWQGFEQGIAVRLAEEYGRAGRKVAAKAQYLVIAGYVAWIVDHQYGLAPESNASQGSAQTP